MIAAGMKRFFREKVTPYQRASNGLLQGKESSPATGEKTHLGLAYRRTQEELPKKVLGSYIPPLPGDYPTLQKSPTANPKPHSLAPDSESPSGS
jgi:hypothetical protein